MATTLVQNSPVNQRARPMSITSWRSARPRPPLTSQATTVSSLRPTSTRAPSLKLQLWAIVIPLLSRTLLRTIQWRCQATRVTSPWAAPTRKELSDLIVWTQWASNSETTFSTLTLKKHTKQQIAKTMGIQATTNDWLIIIRSFDAHTKNAKILVKYLYAKN